MKYKIENNKLGAFLVDFFKLDRPGKGKQELHQDIISISVSGSKSAIRMYYIRKMTLLLFLIAVSIGLTAVSYLAYSRAGKGEEMETLERPGYGEGDRKESLLVWIEGEEEGQDVEITVQEREYTKQEKEALLQNAILELEELMLGENESMDEVRGSLVFPQNMEDGAVEIMWITNPYGVIGEDGSIQSAEDENGTLVEITGTLTCGNQQMTYTSYARVFPPLLSEQEQLYRSVREQVEQADEADIHEENLNLPKMVGDKSLIWMKTAENPFQKVFFLSLLIVICICVQMDNEVHKKAEERRAQLLLDYPDLMWKLTMLLGAGMSIKGAFGRISEEYRRQQKRQTQQYRKRQIRYVYEEVSYTCYEMQSGISEAQAYERFGKRCQLPEYIRIGSVLSQNLKKGAKGLTSMLEMEAEASLNDRKNNARKIGEKAGTKLLLPMILMLGVVLAILMIPAFLSF